MCVGCYLACEHSRNSTPIEGSMSNSGKLGGRSRRVESRPAKYTAIE